MQSTTSLPLRTRYVRILGIALSVVAPLFAHQRDVQTIAVFGGITMVAPGSIASVVGKKFSLGVVSSTQFPLPTTLNHVTVRVLGDAEEDPIDASLYLVAPDRVNFVVPATVGIGTKTVEITALDQTYLADLYVAAVAPAIATAETDDPDEVPAVARVVHVNSAGAMPEKEVLAPIDLSAPGEDVYLTLYGTGFRLHSAPVTATFGDVSVPVVEVVPDDKLPGLDEIRLGPLPAALAGKGKVDVRLFVDEWKSNLVTVEFK